VLPRRLVPLLLLSVLAVVAVDPTARVQAAEEPVAQSPYLKPASDALTLSRRWWNPRIHWYRAQLGGGSQVTLWGVVHLFEAKNALAIARPTAGRKAAARDFAHGAERYWNSHLRPVAGYGPSPGEHRADNRTWYDDNGWWGVAFYDAYRATGDAGFLSSAKRALRFVDSGWDRRDGGIWWSNRHEFHAGESLAGGTLLAASLYNETRSPKYLKMATKYIRWADADFRGDDGLYDRHERDDTPMPYVQGPMFNAFALLCHATGRRDFCDEAEELADRAANRFPTLTMGPQYDSMYIRALLELYRYDGNARWYRIAETEVRRAMSNAREPNGLYLRTWSGGSPRAIGTRLNLLQTHAATTSAIAWLAAAQPPR
jgi:uncharacterized protein YyaL (SSP411 family)